MLSDDELTKWLEEELLNAIRANYRQVFGQNFTPGPKVESLDRRSFIHSGNALGRVYQHVGSPRAGGDQTKADFQFFLMRSDADQLRMLAAAITNLQARGVIYVTEFAHTRLVETELGEVTRLEAGHRYEPTNPLDAIVRAVTEDEDPLDTVS